MDNCIFCMIIDGKIPSTTVYEDDDFKAIERKFALEIRFHKGVVTPQGIVDSTRTSDGFRRHAGIERFGVIEIGFDIVFNFVGQFVAVCRKNLDSVVMKRIMRSTDDDTGIAAHRSRQMRNGRRWQRSGKQHIAIHGIDACGNG